NWPWPNENSRRVAAGSPTECRPVPFGPGPPGSSARYRPGGRCPSACVASIINLAPVARGRVSVAHVRLAGAIQTLAQRVAVIIVVPISAAALKLWYHVFDEVFERARRGGIREVEPVDVCFVYPCFELVGNGLRRTDQHRPHSTDTQKAHH